MDYINKLTPAEYQIAQYVREVFADSLCNAGFVSRDNRDLHWYRIAGDGIVQTLFFFARENRPPFLLELGHGIHPLFSRPAYPSTATIRIIKWDEEVFCPQFPVEPNPDGKFYLGDYSNSIRVICPRNGTRGLHTFERVLLPQMERTTTIDDCCQYHVQKRMERTFHPLDVRFNFLSLTFIDEMIAANYNPMYHYCLDRITDRLAILKKLETQKSLSKAEKDIKQQLEQQLLAIRDGRRNEYLEILEERKQKNLKELISKVGISFP